MNLPALPISLSTEADIQAALDLRAAGKAATDLLEGRIGHILSLRRNVASTHAAYKAAQQVDRFTDMVRESSLFRSQFGGYPFQDVISIDGDTVHVRLYVRGYGGDADGYETADFPASWLTASDERIIADMNGIIDSCLAAHAEEKAQAAGRKEARDREEYEALRKRFGDGQAGQAAK